MQEEDPVSDLYGKVILLSSGMIGMPRRGGGILHFPEAWLLPTEGHLETKAQRGTAGKQQGAEACRP